MHTHTQQDDPVHRHSNVKPPQAGKWLKCWEAEPFECLQGILKKPSIHPCKCTARDHEKPYDSLAWCWLMTVVLQIGRSTESPIDFVVTDTIAGGQEGEETPITQSTISRFACRVVCERNPPFTARIYAAGFDSSKNIFLGVIMIQCTACSHCCPNVKLDVHFWPFKKFSLDIQFLSLTLLCKQWTAT